MDDERSWPKQLLIGLVMLLVVGAVIGVVVAVAGIKVADLAGFNDDAPSTRSNSRLHIPRNADTPTTAPTATTPPTSASTTLTTPPTSASTSKRPKPAFTLAISPARASTYERVNLSGIYRAPDGTTLQIQRMEGGAWVNFPVTTSVSGGRFATYIETGHAGLNRFRMTDPATGRSSSEATVTIG